MSAIETLHAYFLDNGFPIQEGSYREGEAFTLEFEYENGNTFYLQILATGPDHLAFSADILKAEDFAAFSPDQKNAIFENALNTNSIEGTRLYFGSSKQHQTVSLHNNVAVVDYTSDRALRLQALQLYNEFRDILSDYDHLVDKLVKGSESLPDAS